MSDDEAIPAQRIPEKKKSEFAPVAELPIESNGNRTMPTLLKNQIETWVRHGEKLLTDGRFTTLASGGKKVFCLASNDQEKVTAIQEVVNNIELDRAAAAKARAASIPEGT